MADAEHAVAGPDGEVVIRRDEWGIPHARTTSAHDAFFAQGFVQAEDRLGQLEYDRRRASGRWAEVAGPLVVGFDMFARRANLAGAARREYDALDPTSRAVLDAYAEGVNAYLSLDAPPPTDLALAGVTPEPWAPWDCCAVFLVRHVGFASWQQKLWRGRVAALLGADETARLERGAAAPVPLIVPPGATGPPASLDGTDLEAVRTAMAAAAEVGSGSNSWALAGTRTQSGRPLVAGDPHRLVEVPNVYYQCHLACPEFDAIGLAFVGVPGFPHFGHSAHVAWCVTNANGDYQDLFVEHLDGTTPTRDEVIVVRGADPVTVVCAETGHGPVLFGDPASGVAVSLRSTALAEPSRGLSVVLPMLRATSVDELDAALADWVDPVNNVVSADVDGHLRYRTAGQIPVRSRANAWGPVPGWTDAHDWTGVVPYDELPSVRDPATGWLVTANQEIVGPDYPHYLGVDYSRPDRATRIQARLTPLEDATVDDMAAIHQDRRCLAADPWVDALTRLAGADEAERAALDHVRRWDRVMDAGSVGATIYLVTRDRVGRRLAREPRLAPLRTPYPGEPLGTFVPLELRLWPRLPALLVADDRTLLPEGSTWPEVLAAALTDAVTLLRDELGDEIDTWRWGALHVCRPAHPLAIAEPAWAAQLNPPAVEMGGEWDTVWAAAHPAGYGFGVTTASVARYVFDLDDWDRSAWIVPLGAAGDAASPHFADQQPLWAAGTLVPMRYGWDGITEHAESTTTLRPA
ncbi:MAG TPA: penicillin acylase family protein [Acidimicrobiia bacterium]|nr:penicillin acylase family protein [Acidimicrobiia bacterium]